MKKRVLITTALAALSMQVAANPAQQTIDWIGVVPGNFLGSDIGIAAPDGSELRQGLLYVEESGVFGSTTINARAFSLLGDGSDIDPQTPYPDAVNWYVDNMSIEHGGVEGNAYSNDLLEVFLDGNIVAENAMVNTPAGAPNMSISVSYSNVPTGKVTSLDRVRVTGMLYAEGDGGNPGPGGGL